MAWKKSTPWVLAGAFGVAAASGGGSGSSNRDGGGSGDLEGVLEELDELGELDQGHLLESVKELVVGELRHDGRSFH